MKILVTMIAVITITRNDAFKLKEWYEHYLEYKEEVYLHIIVDNGSQQEYLNEVKSLFKDSVIIELGYNGGCTAAYNQGIKYALNDSRVDSVSLLANDIKIEPGGLTKLRDFLLSDPQYGMVAPLKINPKDHTLVESFGEAINKNNMNLILLNRKVRVDTVPDVFLSDSVAGGCNLASRAFYEKVGLQDENFFMYADEVDMGIRGARAGFKFASTKSCRAWHMHINPPGKVNRNPMAAYLMGRNHIYLAKKLFSKRVVLQTILHRIKSAVIFYISCIKHRKNREEYRYAWAFTKGVWAGIIGNMENKF